MSQEVVEELRRRLRDGGFRVSVRGEGGCWVLAAQRGDRVFLVSLRRGRFSDTYVAKVTVPERLPVTAEWSCESLEYTPYGFYVLEPDVGRLAEEIVERFERLEKLLRKWSAGG